MMNYKQFLFLGIAMLMVFATLSSVFATLNTITKVTITTPISGSLDLPDSYVFRGSYEGNSSGNITLFYYNTSFICADTTILTNNATWECTGSLAPIIECTNGIFYATAFNSTEGTANPNSVGYLNSSILTNLKGDSIAPTGMSFTSDHTNGTLKLNHPENYDVASVTDACDTSLTYSVVLTKPAGETVTTTASADTWINGDIDQIGTYSANATASDNAGQAQSTLLEFNSKSEDDISVIIQTAPEVQKAAGIFDKFGNMKLLFFIGLAALVAVLIIILVITQK